MISYRPSHNRVRSTAVLHAQSVDGDHANAVCQTSFSDQQVGLFRPIPEVDRFQRVPRGLPVKNDRIEAMFRPLAEMVDRLCDYESNARHGQHPHHNTLLPEIERAPRRAYRKRYAFRR